MLKIDTINLVSYRISAIPQANLCPPFFDRVNICRVQTWEGIYAEVLFDSDGWLLTDKNLISRIENYYHRKFYPMMFDGEQCYGYVISANGRPRK